MDTIKNIIIETLKECGEIKINQLTLLKDFEQTSCLIGGILDELLELGYINYVIKVVSKKPMIFIFKILKVNNLEKCIDFLNEE